MPSTIAASSVTIETLEAAIGLQATSDSDFFPEWKTDLPALDAWERQGLDRIKAGFLPLLNRASLPLEATVRMTVLHPLLFIANLYTPPLEVKAEVPISIPLTTDEAGPIVEGRMDALVLDAAQFWLMVIESKQAGIAVDVGIPQLLAYMLGNSRSQSAQFGLLTNGSSFLFLKLSLTPTPQYGLSDMYVIRRQENELYRVLQILKKLTHLD